MLVSFPVRSHLKSIANVIVIADNYEDAFTDARSITRDCLGITAKVVNQPAKIFAIDPACDEPIKKAVTYAGKDQPEQWAWFGTAG